MLLLLMAAIGLAGTGRAQEDARTSRVRVGLRLLAGRWFVGR